MTYTSAEAAKLLRSLNDELGMLQSNEELTDHFVAAASENIDDVRPEYDFEENRRREQELLEKIRKLKHAVNLFNVSTTVPGFDMTVDQMLVYIPQLNEQKRRLAHMASRLLKYRGNSYASGSGVVIEYSYANYDVKKAAEVLKEVSDRLARAQTALDVINNSVRFDIDL